MFTGSLGLVAFGQMLRKIHPLVQHASNFDPSIVARSIEQEVPRLTDSIAGRLHSVSAVPKMIGPGSGSDLSAGMAADAIGIIDYIENGLNQQRLVAQPRFRAEPLVSPSENRLDIVLGNGRDE